VARRIRIGRVGRPSVAGALLGALAAIGVLAIGAAPATGEAQATGPTPSSGYFLARGDPRACPSPVCGGLFVHLVNRSRTICGDDARHPSCYVAGVDLSRLDVSDVQRSRFQGLVSAGRAVVRGFLVRGRVTGFPQLDTLVASEVWPASSAMRLPTGVFRLLRDNGVRCVAAPCFSTDAAALNRGTTVTVSRVGLAGVGATTPERNRGLGAIASGGLIAAGRVVVVPRAGPAGAGRVFVASQFYIRAA
jgi:hypothetical protein